MKPPQTEEQKAQTKQRNNLKTIHGSILSAWSFGQLKNWGDVYKKLGLPEDYIESNGNLRTLTFPELKLFLQQQKDELETKFIASASEHKPVTASTQPTSLEVASASKENALKEISSSSEGKSMEVSSAITPHSNESKQPSHIVTEIADSLTSTNNYGWIDSPNQAKDHFAYWFQKKADAELYRKIVIEKKSGVLLLAGTGTGKTFMIGALHRRLMDENYHDGKTFSHIPYLYITRTTVVEQAGRVFQKKFNCHPEVDIEIVNIEQMRSNSGKLWVREDIKIVQGEEVSDWKWKPGINPCIVYFDESQAAKNEESSQHKVMCAYNDLKKNACLISISATPFTRVSEAKCFAVSTHRPLEHLGFPAGTVLTNDNWQSYAHIIAAPASPEDYNEAAINRLMIDLDDWVVRVKGVRPQFEAVNTTRVIDFETKEEREYYYTAWERFQKEKAKMEEGCGQHPFAIITAYSIAAESCKAERLADKMWNDVQNGYAAVCACKWKKTIIKASQFLMNKYGVSRDSIALIWGGGQTAMNKKQKLKRKILTLKSKFEEQGLDVDEMMKDINLDSIELEEMMEFPPEQRLGQQSLEDRQKEIDRFQSGKALFCFYTFKAGGVGLSLHHSDEITTDWARDKEGFKEWFEKIDLLSLTGKNEHKSPLPGKVRRKESGYAVEEDIPFIPVRQRKTTLATTYNAIELAQGLGRVPRLTSLSITEQEMLLYLGTIEQEIHAICSQKMRCISTATKLNENWASMFFGKRSAQEIIETTKDAPTDDSGGIINENEGDDDE